MCADRMRCPCMWKIRIDRGGRGARTYVGLTNIWGVLQLVGSYCGYLLPKQDGGTYKVKSTQLGTTTTMNTL